MHGDANTIFWVLRTALLAVTGLMGGLVSLSLAYCLWLLGVASARAARPTRDRAWGPITRFTILIPAHDEELVIESTLQALEALRYPRKLFRVVLVADNCSDRTIELARAQRGVTVLERSDRDHPGKPAALNWAIEREEPALEWCDAVVIMDADTRMDSGYLAAMDAAMQDADPNRFAAQGYYDVMNPADGWRAALMAGALSLVHFVRPLARESLGLSVGLKGNGMCFSSAVLTSMRWNPASLTEDIDLGLDLIERRGIRVRFVPGAVVSGQMPVTDRSAASQRRRWEGGRGQIVRRRALGLLARGVMRANPVAIDAAIDLLVPPLATLAAWLIGWGVLVFALAAVHAAPAWVIVWWLAAIAGLLIYVYGGFAVAGAPAEAYTALLRAPFYMVWKIAAALRKKETGKTMSPDESFWVRTDRVAIPSKPDSPVSTAKGPK